ncbi:putative zinc finger protein [Apostichopus japonicus]|uniref:Putative zinc finger protein n=1 Tax=Stichopus japonicus TaxID=307972 RepID=A0A2G8KSD8_STIJA|nr:putative zinc finger protein [Apostichopus japonicus]
MLGECRGASNPDLVQKRLLDRFQQSSETLEGVLKRAIRRPNSISRLPCYTRQYPEELRLLAELGLNGAGGYEVPYLGYIEVYLSPAAGDAGTLKKVRTLALVLPESESNSCIPLLIGTNTTLLYTLLEDCRRKAGKRKYENRLKGHQNFSQNFVRGITGSALKKDNVTKHNKSEMHKAAVSYEVGGPSLHNFFTKTPIGNAFAAGQDEEKERVKKLVDIAYVLAKEEIAFTSFQAFVGEETWCGCGHNIWHSFLKGRECHWRHFQEQGGL